MADVGKAKPIYGLLAEFDSARSIFAACEKVRDAGYSRWDSYTPFPVHNLDKAMGIKRSRLPWLVLATGLSGAGMGMLMQWWVATSAYPTIIAAKPLFSWPAFVPVTFELGILLGAFGAVFGMLAFNKLPQYYHSLFNSDRFEKVTDDGFFIAIEAKDPKYDADETRAFLEEIGATHIEAVEE